MGFWTAVECGEVGRYGEVVVEPERLFWPSPGAGEVGRAGVIPVPFCTAVGWDWPGCLVGAE